MKLVRSDAPEVACCITTASIRASRHWPAFFYGLPFNLIILFIVIVLSFLVPARSTAWLGAFMFLVWNVYLLWLLKSSRRNWILAVCADQVYVRLYMTLETAPDGIDEPDVIVFKASEIASMSIRTVETFLYGPKPKLAQCLVIEPAEAVAESVPADDASFPSDWCALGCCGEFSSINLVRVTNEDGRLIIAWRQCHPDLRPFVRQVVRDFPPLVIGPEERSELDLNSIWHGYGSTNLDAQQRRSLLQAKRLGFAEDCARLLTLRKGLSPREVQAYLEEIEQEANAGRPALQS
ncbi:MAG: hypothetical protein WBE72_11125 [Terracidiphilus sp.]